jgi:indolepyruvate ferredoxin oxidoreductase beta subunit
MARQQEPIRLLIAALGGEGGGVLAGWICEAASSSGLVVSRTSIPGVAQRTGATTYYIEMVPSSGARRPILSLNPAPGQVDILVATELLEAARMVQAGFVTPDRTSVIAADRRVFATDEKIAMGDGRVDQEQLRSAVKTFSRRLVLADMARAAEQSGSQINVVMMGVLAGLKVLPIEAETFRVTIRAEARAVDANLRGFEAGLNLALTSPSSSPTLAPLPQPRREELPDLAAFPVEAHEVLAEGVARLADYQNDAYAQRYLHRVARLARLAGADGPFVRELARHLALRMSVEDVIRVAQLKLRGERITRVVGEARARSGDIVDITEYMKPGPEEIVGLLPPAIGRWVLGRIRHDRSWPLKVTTTRFFGFLRLKLLAGLRFWRPRTLRFAEEDAWVERWLSLVQRSLAVDPGAAREVVASAALVRGYADTYKRGLASWNRIMDDVVAPGLDGRLPRGQFADAVLQARLAAQKDPEGDALSRTIEAIVRATRIGRLAAE